MSTASISITLFSVLFALLLPLLLIPIFVWLERRVAGLIQDRMGPNRANVGGFRLGGIVQSFADVVKLVFKEEYYPGHIKIGKWLFTLAPTIMFVASLLAFMTVPFADNLVVDGESFKIQALPVDSGVIWYLAIGSLGIIGIVFGGWLSHNKYSLLGAQRASSQMLGYELPLGLSVISMIITYNSIDFNDMVIWQSQTIFGFIPAWGVIVQPLAAIIFIVAIFAETNRAPFNVAEGESEIVAGHMTEFSAMKFAMFFMAEYVAMNTASAVVITMFFGGYQLPWMDTADMLNNFSAVIIATMIILPISTFVLIRWMRKNNNVRPTVSTDGGRLFETKVLSIVLIAMALIIETVCVYLLTVPSESLTASVTVMFLQIGIFVFKMMLFNVFFIVVRWTLPRFRFDQVQTLGWNYLLPLSIANIVITAIIVVGVN